MVVHSEYYRAIVAQSRSLKGIISPYLELIIHVNDALCFTICFPASRALNQAVSESLSAKAFLLFGCLRIIGCSFPQLQALCFTLKIQIASPSLALTWELVHLTVRYPVFSFVKTKQEA